MTDNKIIKALHFCEGQNGISYCNNCPLFDEDNCVHTLAREAHNLINRQKAAIERLQADKIIAERHEKDARDLFKNTVLQLETAKPEAIKEFAERLKKIMITTSKTEDGYCEYETEDYYIDNLVKEMTEENNG